MRRVIQPVVTVQRRRTKLGLLFFIAPSLLVTSHLQGGRPRLGSLRGCGASDPGDPTAPPAVHMGTTLTAERQIPGQRQKRQKRQRDRRDRGTERRPQTVCGGGCGGRWKFRKHG
ncbi:unnamed protein product [Pleuronectes platessa]|uniref:Uncharacterized protein n=1 Tax=Pleuronectes platessa TaxID=8262 RepID=A0A9N7UFP1_PLEPL|nr:unnamed protein product [Pleuronectes platessa]